jgi:hypothetical protein
MLISNGLTVTAYGSFYQRHEGCHCFSREADANFPSPRSTESASADKKDLATEGAEDRDELPGSRAMM